ncbi:MAG: PKD domain-containing protein [bacterium]
MPLAVAATVFCGACTRDTEAPPTPAPPTVAAAADDDSESFDVLTEAEPDSGPAPLTVQFSVEALLDEDFLTPRFQWDFGDGTAPSSEQNPSHTYARTGEFTAVVRVTNGIGERGSDEVEAAP